MPSESAFIYLQCKIAKESGNEQCIVVSGLSSKESLAIQRMSIAANNQRNLRNRWLQISKIDVHFWHSMQNVSKKCV